MSNNDLLKKLDKLPEHERKAALEWLGIEKDTRPASENPPDIEQAFITHIPDETKTATVAWLAQCRTIMASDTLSAKEKASKIMAVDANSGTLAVLKNVGGAALSGYKNLPLALRVALPATVLATPFLGGAGVGIAALGGAIGVPALLVFFLGVTGITSVMEALLGRKGDDPEAIFLQGVLAMIATDAAIIRMNQTARAAIAREVRTPQKQPYPRDWNKVSELLLNMNPIEFERHVMGFFAAAGMTAWVTPASNDAGIDGVAKDGHRLILVQCKRYAPHNSVGRPDIQQFKGVLEENAADLGVFVTTSSFTTQAVESAGKSDKLLLIDMDRLLRWHFDKFSIED